VDFSRCRLLAARSEYIRLGLSLLSVLSPPNLSNHVDLPINLLHQMTEQPGKPRQRLIAHRDRISPRHRLTSHLHQIDDGERPVAEIEVAADRVEALEEFKGLDPNDAAARAG